MGNVMSPSSVGAECWSWLPVDASEEEHSQELLKHTQDFLSGTAAAHRRHAVLWDIPPLKATISVWGHLLRVGNLCSKVHLYLCVTPAQKCARVLEEGSSRCPEKQSTRALHLACLQDALLQEPSLCRVNSVHCFCMHWFCAGAGSRGPKAGEATCQRAQQHE